MQPLVSILIPAYNAERWIGDTLRSATSQTWPNTEIIVVDDGSKDGTSAAAERFASARVRVVSKANGGAASARNTALSLSQGDWIQWLDADDLLAPDKIQRQMDALSRHPDPRTLISSAWGEFMSRPGSAHFRRTLLWQDLPAVEWLLTQLEHNLHMQTATWLVSRQLCEAAGPWNVRLAAAACDDGEYFSRVILASNGIRFVPEAKVFYRVVGRNRLSYVGRSQHKMEALLLGLQLYFTNLRAADDSARVRAACIRYLQTTLNEHCPESDAVLRRAAEMAAECGGSLDEPKMAAKYAVLQSLLGRAKAKHIQLTYNHWKALLFRSWDEAMFRVGLN
jgi:glycosyltransferase involved in cell wall biosynthesis